MGSPKSGSHRYLVRAVPALVLAAAALAAAAAVAVAYRGGWDRTVPHVSSVGPIDIRVYYAVPTPQLLLSGLLTVLAVGAGVAGLDLWAARRVTDPARHLPDARERLLRTVMSQNFLERAAHHLDTRPDLDAVGGVFFVDVAPGLLTTAAAQRVRALRP